MRTVSLGRFAVIALCLGTLLGQSARDEEGRDPFKKWIERDVVYVISREEKAVFKKLTTEDEKLAFIEQFWRARDTSPETGINEYKEEHYRRIAYANEKFASGKPGWKTDRGMIYIKFGPPDRRQTNPTGGRVYRSQQELIASDRKYAKDAMTALPYEVWEYRYLPGLGQEVAFEFVSKDGTTNYKLVMSADDKDALYFTTGSRIVEGRRRYQGLLTFNSNPLVNLEKFVAAHKPLPARPDESFVSSQVHFSELPFELEFDARGEGEDTFVDVLVKVPHSALSFNREIDVYKARVDIEIFVRDIRKIVVAHRADELSTALRKEEFKRAASEKSAYPTRFTLPPGRYLLEVWIKDVLGGAASFKRDLVVVPRLETVQR